MSLASVGVRTVGVTINTASCEIRTAAGAKARILSMEVVQAAGVAQSIALGRPAAVGITPATTSLFQRDDTTDPACVTSINLSWGTSPTNPTIANKRWNSAATIGVGIIWTWPRGFIIPISSSVSIANITTGQVCDVTATIDE